MNQMTHKLNIEVGIDFTKVLSEPNLSGVMMALNVKSEEDVIAAYSRHIYETILTSISGREELLITKSELSQLEIEDGSEEVSEFSQEVEAAEEIVVNEEVPNTDTHEQNEYLSMIIDSINETEFMEGMSIAEIQVKPDVLSQIGEGVELISGHRLSAIQEFEEDLSYGMSIPYKLILEKESNKNETTTLLGGI